MLGYYLCITSSALNNSSNLTSAGKFLKKKIKTQFYSCEPKNMHFFTFPYFKNSNSFAETTNPNSGAITTSPTLPGTVAPSPPWV